MHCRVTGLDKLKPKYFVVGSWDKPLLKKFINILSDLSVISDLFNHYQF